MAADFEFLKNVRGPIGRLYAPLVPQAFTLFDCKLEMVPSKTSLGLQLIDVVLYLVSRHLNGSYLPRQDACRALLNYLRSEDRAIINQMLYTPQKDFGFAELESMAFRSSMFHAGAPSFQIVVQTEQFRRAGMAYIIPTEAHPANR